MYAGCSKSGVHCCHVRTGHSQCVAILVDFILFKFRRFHESQVGNFDDSLGRLIIKLCWLDVAVNQALRMRELNPRAA